MEEFQYYSPEEIILSNLEEVIRRSMLGHEQEFAHLSELATEIASQLTDSTSFLAFLPEHRLPVPRSGDGQNASPVVLPDSFRRTLSTFRRVQLCTELEKHLPAARSLWQEFFFPETEEPDRSFFNRISYQKNHYTDAAYQIFSALLPEPRAVYAHSFSSVCADVYNRLSEYCILPVENSAEGRLNTFSRLIVEYDLKIAAVCEVRTEKDRVTRFALLRRTIAPLRSLQNLPLCFEFSCELTGYPAPEDVLAAARFCGLTLLRADISLPEAVSDSDRSILRLHPVFNVENGDFPAFLLYLAMEVPGANFIGLYSKLPGTGR